MVIRIQVTESGVCIHISGEDRVCGMFVMYCMQCCKSVCQLVCSVWMWSGLEEIYRCLLL